MTVFEDFVLEQVQGGHTIIGLYPLLDGEVKIAFAAWQEKRGR